MVFPEPSWLPAILLPGGGIWIFSEHSSAWIVDSYLYLAPFLDNDCALSWSNHSLFLASPIDEHFRADCETIRGNFDEDFHGEVVASQV